MSLLYCLTSHSAHRSCLFFSFSLFLFFSSTTPPSFSYIPPPSLHDPFLFPTWACIYKRREPPLHHSSRLPALSTSSRSFLFRPVHSLPIYWNTSLPPLSPPLPSTSTSTRNAHQPVRRTGQAILILALSLTLLLQYYFSLDISPLHPHTPTSSLSCPAYIDQPSPQHSIDHTASIIAGK